MSEELTIPTNTAMTIRRVDLADADLEALRALAQRDSRPASLDGPVLGIWIEGRLLAAISLADGATVADPFSRTEELQGILELRAAQLRRRAKATGRLHSLRVRRGRGAPALGGSPAGQLLTLPRWG